MTEGKYKVITSLDAVSLEHTLADALGDEMGERGLSHDADCIRGGSMSDVGITVERLVARVRTRLGSLEIRQDEETKKLLARMDHALEDLQSYGSALAVLEDDREPFNDRWKLLASCAAIISTILSLIEEKAV